MSSELFRGSSWSLIWRWSVRSIGLVNTIILARLLVPEDFGIVAIATLVIGLLDSIFELSVGLLLIRLPKLTDDYCNTAWTLKVLKGVVLCGLIIVSTPLVVAYFSEPRVSAVLLVMSIVPLFRGLESIGPSLLLRENQFRRDFWYRFVARIALLVATVSLAFWLGNYWAIVAGSVFGAFFEMVLTYLVHSYRPRLSLARWRELLGFSSVLMARGVAEFLARRIDVLFVGRVADTVTLGTYNMATELVSIVTREPASAISRGAYPTYSKLVTSPAELVHSISSAIGLMLLVCVPLGFGLATVATDFVAVIFGPKWGSIVPFLYWLAPAGVAYALVYLMSGGILVALGHEAASTLITWGLFVLRAAAVLFGGLFFGLNGMIIALSIGGLIAIPFAVCFLTWLSPFGARDFLLAAWRPVMSGGIMVALIFAIQPLLLEDSFIKLVIEIGFGALVYFFSTLLLVKLSGIENAPEHALLSSLNFKLKAAPDC